MDPMRTIAAADIGDAMLWLGILLGLVFIGCSAIFAIRRRMKSSDVPSGGELDLDSFRKLLTAGKITPVEFEAARAAIVARHGGGGTPRSVSPIDPAHVRARPGVDLTGAPLPPIAGDRGDVPKEGPEN